MAHREYLFRLPRAIPSGTVLVHNHVRPTRRLGLRGFRVWLQRPDEGPAVEKCDCPWASELGAHSRVRRVQLEEVPQ